MNPMTMDITAEIPDTGDFNTADRIELMGRRASALKKAINALYLELDADQFASLADGINLVNESIDDLAQDF